MTCADTEEVKTTARNLTTLAIVVLAVAGILTLLEACGRCEPSRAFVADAQLLLALALTLTYDRLPWCRR